MAVSKISVNSGIEAIRNRLNAVDPKRTAYNTVFGKPGTKYAEAPNVGVEGTISKLIEGHNDYVDLKAVLDRRPF